MVNRTALSRLLSVFAADRPRIEATIHACAKGAATADVLQDTWIKLAAYNADGVIENPSAFVRSVARNTATDYLRKERLRNSLDGEVRELLWETQDEFSPERILIGRQVVAMLTDAIANLPAQTRRVFLLNRFDRKTHREIAAELGMSEQAVYYHIRRALEALSDLRPHLPD